MNIILSFLNILHYFKSYRLNENEYDSRKKSVLNSFWEIIFLLLECEISKITCHFSSNNRSHNKLLNARSHHNLLPTDPSAWHFFSLSVKKVKAWIGILSRSYIYIYTYAQLDIDIKERVWTERKKICLHIHFVSCGILQLNDVGKEKKRKCSKRKKNEHTHTNTYIYNHIPHIPMSL